VKIESLATHASSRKVGKKSRLRYEHSMSQMTLITGPERRRRWSEDEQRQILAAAFAPDANVRDVSRQYDVATDLTPVFSSRWS
jgi:Transposase